MSARKNKKQVQHVSNRLLTFFGGLFLCLISLSLVINIGWINRAFTYVFSFLFGASSLLVYCFLFALGISFIFREKGITIKFHWTYFLPFIGLILLFISSLVFFSIVINGNDIEFLKTSSFLEMMNNMYEIAYFNEETSEYGVYSGYFNYPVINLFSKIKYHIGGLIPTGSIESGIDISSDFFDNDPNFGFGGGYLGLVLCVFLLRTTGTGITWFFIIAGIVLSFALILCPSFVKFIKRKKEKPSEKNNILHNSNESSSNGVFSSHTPINSNIVTKSDYENQPNSVTFIKEAANYQESSTKGNPYSLSNKTLKPTFSFGGNEIKHTSFPNEGAFIKAHFVKSSSKDTLFPSLEIPSSTKEEPTETEEVIKEHSEQLVFDFEAKPEINEELVMSKPVFEEVKVVSPILESKTPSFEKPAPQIIKKKDTKWIPPSTELLDTLETSAAMERNTQVAEERKLAIDLALSDFKIGAHVIDYVIGPSVTRFNIAYESNAVSKAITAIVDDLSRRLNGVAARFEPIVEGKPYSGLEIPNATITSVSFKDIYEKLPDVKKHPLAIAFGKNISGDVVCADFNEFPHALVAGTTGSGKSIFIHSLIATLIMRNSPETCRIALVDPKRVEFAKYRDIPQLLCPVMSDMSIAALFFAKLCEEMNDRYTMFEETGVTKIEEYNEIAEETGREKMPYIVAIVDEYGDLVTNHKEVAQPIMVLGQKARASGIHMLIATQSPSTNIITGSIKSNLGTHVALATANTSQSIVILGEGGAEKLLGKGDMLVQSPIISRVSNVRLQGCYIQNKEIMRIVGYLKDHYEVNYNPKFLNLEEAAAQAGQEAVMNGTVASSMDPAEEAKYQSIKDWVMSQPYMSMSRIQGECGVGFNRARRFFTRLQQEGVVDTKSDGNKGSRVLSNSSNSGDYDGVTSEDYCS